MKRAVYPGSFDPITNGHVDIIERLCPHFDEVIVLISQAQHKSYLFSAEQRLQLAEKSLKHLSSVKVDSSTGLTVEYAKQKDSQVIVRGIRAVADFEYEMAMAGMNKKLANEIETMIVFSSPEYSYVSSRMVKELARYQGDLEHLVPAPVKEALKDIQF